MRVCGCMWEGEREGRREVQAVSDIAAPHLKNRAKKPGDKSEAIDAAAIIAGAAVCPSSLKTAPR